MKSGAIYTRRWVVNLILDLAGYTAGEAILHGRVMEPSCGKGAFLVEIARRLVESMRMRGESDWNVLRDRVRAYEIDEESLGTARSAVMDALISQGCPVASASAILDDWLFEGDFLLADEEPCDWVVGNPPYVRATDIDKAQREKYVQALPSVTAGCDLYVGFYDKGLSLLKEAGTLAFICADRWLQNSYGRKLRGRINESPDLFGNGFDFSLLLRLHGVDAFESEVDAYPAITVITRGARRNKLRLVTCDTGFGERQLPAVREWLSGNPIPRSGDGFEACALTKPRGDEVYPLGDCASVRFVSTASSRCPLIGETVRIGIGIATGCDEVFLTDRSELVESSRMMPMFVMRDHRRARPGAVPKERWLINPWDSNGQLVNLDDFPRMKTYLESNENRLRQRHVARRNEESWYRTIDKVRPELLDEELLLMPDMAALPDPVLSKGKYPHHNCYWLASDVWDLEVLGGLLMSDSVAKFVGTLGVKMRGGTMRFQAQYLRMLHVPAYAGLDKETKEGLREAFRAGDRLKASRYARKAYASQGCEV